MQEVERGTRRSRRRRAISPPYRQGRQKDAFRPVDPEFGDDPWDLLVLVVIMLSGMGFFAEFVAARLNRRLRTASAQSTSAIGAC